MNRGVRYNGFYYSPKYSDGKYEYRHVNCPANVSARFNTSRLLSEAEWRAFGIQMSPGWEHYDWHAVSI